nr:DUF4358 domain-containing protein [uncultured Niameybacter sp.]
MKLNKKLIGLMLALTIGGALVGCSSGNNQAEDNNEQILQEQEGLDEIENQEATEENQTDEVKDETKEEGKDEAKDEIKEDTAKEENKAESVRPETSKPEATKPTETTPVQKPESKPETSKPQTKPESKPEASKPQTKPESKPETSKPETKPESKPETSKPQTKPEVTAMSAQELMGKVITDSMEIPMLNPMDSTYFADTYGIDTSLLKSYEVRMPVMIVHSSEIGIFELNNASDAEKVIAGIEKRVEGLKSQWQSYLPDQYELVQNYKTATKGNYVIFVVSEYADTIISSFNAQVK